MPQSSFFLKQVSCSPQQRGPKETLQFAGHNFGSFVQDLIDHIASQRRRWRFALPLFRPVCVCLCVCVCVARVRGS